MIRSTPSRDLFHSEYKLVITSLPSYSSKTDLSADISGCGAPLSNKTLFLESITST